MKFTDELRMADIESFVKDYVNCLVRNDYRACIAMEAESNEPFFHNVLCSDFNIDYVMRKCKEYVKMGKKPVWC